LIIIAGGRIVKAGVKTGGALAGVGVVPINGEIGDMTIHEADHVFGIIEEQIGLGFMP
jgi:hypothetical protein